MKYLFFPLALIFLAACNNAKEPVNLDEGATNDIDMEKELAGIDQVRTNFARILKEGRYEDMGQLVSSEVKTVRPGGSDWDTMFALGKERGRFPYDSIIMTPTETYIMNDTMAYDWGSSKVYYTNVEGETVELRNSFLVILKKENGAWKLHREVGSSFVE